MFLRELFPDHNEVCITVVHNPRGIQGEAFSYCHEYAHIVRSNGGIQIWPIDRHGVERKWRYKSKSLEKVLHATRVAKNKGDFEIALPIMNKPYKTVSETWQT